jgi:hypothetical protein
MGRPKTEKSKKPTAIPILLSAAMVYRKRLLVNFYCYDIPMSISLPSAYANVLVSISSLPTFTSGGIGNIKLLSAFRYSKANETGVHPRSAII